LSHRAPDLETPAKCLDTVGETSQAGASVRRGSPDPIVSHLDDQSAWVSLQLDHRRGRLGMSGHIGQGLTHDEEGGELDLLGHPVLGGSDHFNRHGGTSRHRLEGNSEAMVAHRCGMDAVGEVA
jgi:hypothetical protein